MSTIHRSKFQYAGTRSLRISVGKLHLWYSFDELIAFQIGNDPIVAVENRWSNATAGHLNKIAPKHQRVAQAEFESRLADAMTKAGLAD